MSKIIQHTISIKYSSSIVQNVCDNHRPQQLTVKLIHTKRSRSKRSWPPRSRPRVDWTGPDRDLTATSSVLLDYALPIWIEPWPLVWIGLYIWNDVIAYKRIHFEAVGNDRFFSLDQQQTPEKNENIERVRFYNIEKCD